MKKNQNMPPVIYTNDRSITLYMVSLITFSLSIFVFYMIFSDLNKFFIEYSSKLSGILWMIFMIIAGNIMFFCMLWLSGRYVLKIENAEEGFINVKTWSVLGFYKTRKYPRAILENQKYYDGYTRINRVPTVSAPWIKLKTPNGKSLVVDAQGNFY